MIERKKDRFLGERNLSFLFVEPPIPCGGFRGCLKTLCVRSKKIDI